MLLLIQLFKITIIIGNSYGSNYAMCANLIPLYLCMANSKDRCNGRDQAKNTVTNSSECHEIKDVVKPEEEQKLSEIINRYEYKQLHTTLQQNYGL
jgi:hypothetical protein